MWHHGPRAKEDAFEVDRNNRIERVGGHRPRKLAFLPLYELRIARDARIVDEHIHAAPTRNNFFDGSCNIGFVTYIYFAEERLASLC